MEVATRVAWTTINPWTKRPTPTALLRAVQEMLAKPVYRQQARLIGDEFARYDSPRRAAELLERLL